MLVHLICIWNILLQFGNLVVSWYIFSPFGILYQEKSGNPDELAENAAEQKKAGKWQKGGKNEKRPFRAATGTKPLFLELFLFF
jgi:hypothetical protein